MKKDIEWLKRSIDKRIKTIESDDITFVGSEYYDEGYIDGMRDVLYRINQLDEPDEREQLEIAYKDILSRREFWFDGKWYKVVEKEESLSDGEVKLIVGFDGGTESYSLNSVDEAFETLTDYGSKYEVVPKQEEVDRAYNDGYEKGKEHATEKERETETVASVFLDFLIASAKLKLALGMEVEELEE